MYSFVNVVMSEIVTWTRKIAVSSQSVIVCGGKSRCLVLFISFLQYLKAVLFHSVSVNECPWTKKQDLSLVTAEGIKSKGNRGSSTFMGLGRSWHGRQSSFLTHLPLLKRDETVSGYRCVRHFGKRKRGPWCNCLIDSVAGQRGLRSGSQGVWREKHCQGLGSVKVLTGEACWG